jgi:hypothetical protein
MKQQRPGVELMMSVAASFQSSNRIRHILPIEILPPPWEMTLPFSSSSIFVMSP